MKTNDKNNNIRDVAFKLQYVKGKLMKVGERDCGGKLNGTIM